MIRQPIICVMGHVDSGKTSLLDAIRSSAIAAREAGGITQHIGASEVPLDVIEQICGPVLRETKSKLVIPGLLFIDTPGHEAFTNLRKIGGSAADMAIIVADVSKGFEPQTIEAVNILKGYKTPFIVAANKVDALTGWHDTKSRSVHAALGQQGEHVLRALEDYIYGLIGNMSELGFTSERYDRVKDFQKEVAIVPVSARTGEGLAELLMLVSGLSQKFLELRLSIEVKGPGRGSILEKKEVKGLGTTIDIILYEGSLHVNDTVAFAVPGGVAAVKIKALLKPKPLHEIRESSSKFFSIDSVNAAAGVKISGNGLEEALPGSPLIQTTDKDYMGKINSELGSIFSSDRTGIILKADSIGSIEALSMLLSSQGVRVSRKGLGNVTKRDVLDAFAMSALDPKGAMIVSFNVQTEKDAFETAGASGVTIIEGNIIYKLLDDYNELAAQIDKRCKEELERELVFPGEIEVLPNSCFRVSHPAIFGVTVARGRIKPGYTLMGGDGAVIGKIKGMQNDKAAVEAAGKGESVAISMEGVTFGRQVRERQRLFTRVRDGDERQLAKSSLLSDEERALLAEIIGLKRLSKEQE